MTTAAFSPSNDSLLKTAYLAVLPELEALAPSELVPVNLDVMAAVMTATGVVPELRALRDRVAALADFDLASFDRLHDYALAAGYAHAQHLIAAEPEDDLRELHAAGARLRELLLTDAQALASRGLVASEALRDLRGANGYKNLATDLQMLVNLLEQNWERIAGKCATTEAELRSGAEIVTRIVHVVGLREQGPAGVARTAELRQRAFTLFTRTYDQARRAVQYVRWNEDDADDIVPSLYAGRGGSARKKPEQVQPENEETNLGLGVTPGPATPAASSAPTPSGLSKGGPFVS